jgi:AraC-like DNA-binding protein
MAAAQAFSTEGMRPPDRLPFWNAGAAAIGGVEIEEMARCPFNGTVVRRTLGAAKIFRLGTSPHRAAWTSRLIRQSSEELPVRLCFQQSGRTILISDGVERVIEAGQWFMADGRRPFVSIHPETSSKIALQIPVDRLTVAEADAVRKLAGGAPIGGAIARMLGGCLETAISDFSSDDDRLDSDLGETMIDFFRMAIRENLAGERRASMRDLTQERIRAFVRRNLGNPDLSVDLIARAMKCSKRYIHKLFSGDQTVSDYIWSLRLDRCRAVLSSPAGRDITLTQLAFDTGFSSSAHFSRTFRDKFGTPPKAFRARMLDVGSPADKRPAHEAASQLAAAD